MTGRGRAGGVELLERSSELATIANAVRSAAEGEGSVLVVEGPAGIGKTALLAAGRDAARAAGLTVLAGRGASSSGTSRSASCASSSSPRCGRMARRSRARPAWPRRC